LGCKNLLRGTAAFTVPPSKARLHAASENKRTRLMGANRAPAFSRCSTFRAKSGTFTGSSTMSSGQSSSEKRNSRPAAARLGSSIIPSFALLTKNCAPAPASPGTLALGCFYPVRSRIPTPLRRREPGCRCVQARTYADIVGKQMRFNYVLQSI